MILREGVCDDLHELITIENVMGPNSSQQIRIVLDLKQNPIIHRDARFIHFISPALYFLGAQRGVVEILSQQPQFPIGLFLNMLRQRTILFFKVIRSSKFHIAPLSSRSASSTLS